MSVRSGYLNKRDSNLSLGKLFFLGWAAYYWSSWETTDLWIHGDDVANQYAANRWLGFPIRCLVRY